LRINAHKNIRRNFFLDVDILMPINMSMNARGRPRTGRRGQPVNIYLPHDLVKQAKQSFYNERGISLSEGIRALILEELDNPRILKKAAN
jgi:hypothetical protein